MNGIFYSHNSEWKLSPCTQCRCDMGQILCNKIQCESLRCEVKKSVQNQCCPVCTGECRSTVGELIKSGETWTEDNDCTTCKCSNGFKICTSESCARLGCLNPVKKPGQCCPVCEPLSNTSQYKLLAFFETFNKNTFFTNLKLHTSLKNT